MNYYEHEIKVKIIDGVLAHEQNWEWFIHHTENTFIVELKGDTLDAALSSFREVREVFYHLSKIHEITECDLPITKAWLKEIDVLAQFYNGSLDLCGVALESSFSKIMRLLIYAGKIYGQDKNQKYFYFTDIFTLRNLFERESLDSFAEDEDTILRLLDSAAPSLKNERQIFLDNINRIVFPVDLSFVARHSSKFNSANCFSFSSVSDSQIRVWEEQELLHMLSISVKDGKIVPMIDYGDSFFPDYTMWTKSVLSHIKDYFQSPDVTFVVESIGYLMYGEIPSSDTINKHFALLYDLCETTDAHLQSTMMCSSIEVIISFFTSGCKKLIDADSYRKYGAIQNKLHSNGCSFLLLKLKNNGALLDKTIIQKMRDEAEAYRDKVDEITDYEGFTKYLQNDFIRGSIANDHFNVLSQKFETIIESIDNIRVAHLFLVYFEFLLQIKNNKDVSSRRISTEIIKIRTLWKHKYYAISCASMQTVSTDPIAIPAEYSGQLLSFIQKAPSLFARQRMKLQDTDLIQRMQLLSDSPFSMMVSRIVISEDFPSHPILRIDGKHPIDQMYVHHVNQIKTEYAYKFRNNFSAKEYTEGIFDGIKKEMQFSMALLKDLEPLYAAVMDQNPDYSFLDYSSELRLAHITQLFPILENKIREFGELCGIVPIRENIEECHRLKEPDTVLKSIISQVIDSGGSISNTADLYFIHFCMFGENGLNIRNECIHGLNYCQGSQLLFGFKVTLIALYMIGWRTELVLKNMSGPSEGTVEKLEQEGKSICNHKSFWLRILQFIKKVFHI